MVLHSGSVTAAVTRSRWTSSATDKKSQDPFRTENTWAKRKKFFWRSNEVREMFCKRLQHDAINTAPSWGLLMRASVTILVVSKEVGDLLSAVVGNQTNIECWIKNPEPVASRSWCLQQWAACCLPFCLQSPLAVFHHVPTSIYHSILRFEHMVILTKIPNPHHQQAEWPKGLRTLRLATQWKPNYPTKHPKSVFTLQCQTTQKEKKKLYLLKFAIIKLVFSALFKARVRL